MKQAAEIHAQTNHEKKVNLIEPKTMHILCANFNNNVERSNCKEEMQAHKCNHLYLFGLLTSFQTF